ncbi:response regulator [Deinococcus sp. HMF7620]|uniref:Response regulator n=1 Tax=Deinococcus arboris TaxID=2682977 RepID=A0A7C9M8K2_9DEIO|nr:response regulator [Deinococcus arboris]MVN87003.1 response regulator [Deinococcus arboris]
MTAAAPHPPSILIVDDSPGLLHTMESMLRPHLPVTLADSGSAALERLTPDTALVLTDVRMPGMSGVELAQRLRRTHPDLPVVFMSGIVEDELRAQARALGVLDVLRKPLRAERLFPALQEWLAGQLILPDPKVKVAPVPPPSPAPAPRLGPIRVTPEAPQGQAAPVPAEPAAVPAPPEPEEAPASQPLAAPTSTQRQEAASRLQAAEQAQAYIAGLSVLPGVSAAGAFDSSGAALSVTTEIGAEVGAYLRFLMTAAQTLTHHLAQPLPIKALQVEFQEQVLVVCPVPGGVVAALVRDTPSASGVKAWLRHRLN